jgi:hypothetical protein
VSELEAAQGGQGDLQVHNGAIQEGRVTHTDEWDRQEIKEKTQRTVETPSSRGEEEADDRVPQPTTPTLGLEGLLEVTLAEGSVIVESRMENGFHLLRFLEFKEVSSPFSSSSSLRDFTVAPLDNCTVIIVYTYFQLLFLLCVPVPLVRGGHQSLSQNLVVSRLKLGISPLLRDPCYHVSPLTLVVRQSRWHCPSTTTPALP